MVGRRVGDRALPLSWLAEEGPANISVEGQKMLLDRVRAWLPDATNCHEGAGHTPEDENFAGVFHAKVMMKQLIGDSLDHRNLPL